jgi:hypothetical protein
MRARSHPGRKALAYHEAGHAVVGYALGLEIEEVTIIPNETSLGQCRYRDWDAWFAATDLDASLSVILAGAVAEELATGRPSGGTDDLNALLLSRRRWSGDVAAERLALVRRRTAAFLEEHWPIVKSLAVTLRKERALDGPVAMRALRRAFGTSRLPAAHPFGLLPASSLLPSAGALGGALPHSRSGQERQR